jgi:hypothetical protein
LLLVIFSSEGPRYYPGEKQTKRVEEQTKGDHALLVYRKSRTRIEKLEAGAEVEPGDLIQLAYRADGAAYGVILSIDGWGTVNLHFPQNKYHPTDLEPRGIQLLPYSFELDRAPHYERFFFITSDEPIDVNLLLRTVRNVGRDPETPLVLQEGLWQKELLLKKQVYR